MDRYADYDMPPSPRGGGGRGRSRSPPPPPRPSGGYKVLCVSSLHSKASDDVVRDTLYREYKKYGDISVRVVQDPDERVAYVYFRLEMETIYRRVMDFSLGTLRTLEMLSTARAGSFYLTGPPWWKPSTRAGKGSIV